MVSTTCVTIHYDYLHAWHIWSLAQHPPQHFRAAETSWEVGHSALDFTLVLFNGPAQIRLHNTPYLCYNGYLKPYSSFLWGHQKSQEGDWAKIWVLASSHVSIMWGRKLQWALWNQCYRDEENIKRQILEKKACLYVLIHSLLWVYSSGKIFPDMASVQRLQMGNVSTKISTFQMS